LWPLINLPVVGWMLISINITNSYSGGSVFQDVGILDRVVRAFKILGFYIGHTIIPLSMSFGYPPLNPGILDRNFYIGISTSLLLLLIALRRKGIESFASTIYITFLIPALQLFGRFFYVAGLYDRYLSIPLLGICILFERVIVTVLDKINRNNLSEGHPSHYSLLRSMKIYIGRVTASSVVIAVIISLSLITVSYVPTFKSDIDSTRNSYEKFPYWPSSGFNYVYSLIEGGRLDEAWEITIREGTFAYPLWVRTYFVGWIYLERGDIKKAIEMLSYSSFLAVDGGYYPFPSVPLGRALISEGRYREAETEFRRVLSFPVNQPIERYHAKKELERIGIGYGRIR